MNDRRVDRVAACAALSCLPLAYAASVAGLLGVEPSWHRPLAGLLVAGHVLERPFALFATKNAALPPVLAWSALVGSCVVAWRTRLGDVHCGILGGAMALWMWLGMLCM